MNAARSLLCLLVLLCTWPAWGQTLIVIPAESQLTREFIAQIADESPLAPFQITTLSEATLTSSTERIITLGRDALNWRLEQSSDLPTLALYINRRQVPDQRPDWLQIMLSSPDPQRQVRLAKALVPRLGNLGLLYTLSSIEQLDEWQAAADSQELQMVTRLWPDDAPVTRPLTELLSASDALIALDDPAIWNADLLKTILLTSYARDRVIIGPAAPFVDAGSLGTTYSTPMDMALSTRHRFSQPWQPGAVFYPTEFSLRTNAQVARSLSLPLPDNAALLDRLKAEESAP